MQPYHKYVFDTDNRKFVGQFEEMYQSEDSENYDSWFQEDLTHIGKQISVTILNRYNFNSILDIGCGKGAFTHLLKKSNCRVVGTDISETAITKAKSKYRDVEFYNLTAKETLEKTEVIWDLIIMSEILSYLENWKEVLESVSLVSNYVYISLYLPPNPIGFVKSFEELKNEINKYFDIHVQLLWNDETIFILGGTKKKPE
jgi:SAM-dependent methyltransferase